MRPESEIKDKLESLRKQYAESDKNPIVHTKDYGTIEYFKEFENREEQIRIEAQLRDEIAILEWALKDPSHWLTSWMRRRS
jgi:hypothetical protein